MFIISCDLAKTSDYTAISILETAPAGRYHLRYLKRPALGTDYIKIASELQRLHSSPALMTSYAHPPPALVIDSTGVGEAVGDILAGLKVPFIGIKIHGGKAVKRMGNTIHVPKRDLVKVLLRVFNDDDLLAAVELVEVKNFLHEMQRFTVNYSDRGHDSYNGSGAHDDIVLSVAMGVFIGEEIRRKSYG